jgi:Abnormal spindle-like microcephaly-assoc'd, ASPM-SPD-2-Hydin
MLQIPDTQATSRILSSVFIRVFGTAALVAGLLSMAACMGGGVYNSIEAGPLRASSSTVSFGNVTVGTSTAQLVSLENTGTSNVKISSVMVSGKGLSVSGGSKVTLSPDQSVTFSVNFSPSGEGSVQGAVTVSSDARHSPLRIPITGKGVTQAAQHTVNLSWQPSSSVVLGYYVYRGPAASNLSKLTGTIDPSTSYVDSSVQGGETYVYAVTSVASNNVESAPSSPVTVTIPSN